MYQNIMRSFNHILIDEQHRFKSGKSTVTIGVSFFLYINESIRSGNQLDIIITDYKKSFNTINFYFLLINLRNSFLATYYLYESNHIS